jgi:hypothetical protein
MRSEAIGYSSDGDTVALAEVTAAARQALTIRCSPTLLPADPDDCPTPLRLAIMMRAASLLLRRDSPSGIVSFSPDSVFRVNRFDADVDELIAEFVVPFVA